MLASYGAAIGLVTNDTREFARDVLLRVALLDGWAETNDDVASILYGLLWLGRIGGETYRAVLGGASQDYLCRTASELDDEELGCLLAGRRYDPLPEGSIARNLAAGLWREALIVLRDNRLRSDRVVTGSFPRCGGALNYRRHRPAPQHPSG
jgi:hypothetical protein